MKLSPSISARASAKTRMILWSIPAFLIGFGIALLLCSPVVQRLSGQNSFTSGQLCYYRGVTGPGGTDYELIVMTPTGPDTYTGIYNWVPAEKDTSRGYWHGLAVQSSDGDQIAIDALSTMSGEGRVYNQQQIMHVSPTEVALGHGDLQSVNGVNTYRDPSQLNFTSHTLPRVECSSVPIEAW